MAAIMYWTNLPEVRGRSQVVGARGREAVGGIHHGGGRCRPPPMSRPREIEQLRQCLRACLDRQTQMTTIMMPLMMQLHTPKPMTVLPMMMT